MSKWTKKGRFSICCTIGGHKWEEDNKRTTEYTSYLKCWHCGEKVIVTKPFDPYNKPILYTPVDLLWLLEDE